MQWYRASHFHHRKYALSFPSYYTAFYSSVDSFYSNYTCCMDFISTKESNCFSRIGTIPFPIFQNVVVIDGDDKDELWSVSSEWVATNVSFNYLCITDNQSDTPPSPFKKLMQVVRQFCQGYLCNYFLARLHSRQWICQLGNQSEKKDSEDLLSKNEEFKHIMSTKMTFQYVEPSHAQVPTL